MSPQDESPKKPEGPADIAGMLGLGGILSGVSQILTQFGELAEKGEQLRRASGQSSTESKGIAGEYGFSVKFGAGTDQDRKVTPLHKSSPGKHQPERQSTTVPVPASPRLREPQVDVFDEHGQVLIIAEMPGVSADDVRLDFEQLTLKISGKSRAVEYGKQVSLPRPCKPEDVSVTAHNGIVEIRIQPVSQTPEST